MLIGLGGCWLIGGTPAAAFAANLSSALLLLAALCWSVFFVLQRPLLARYSPLEVTSYAVWTGTLFLLPFAPLAVLASDAADPASTWAAVYLGLFPTGIAYVCWSHVLAVMPVARAASYTYAVPVLSALIAYGWLGERATIRFALGGATVLLGVALAALPNRPGRGDSASST